ncbi:MAG: UPF0147 family protein [Candidatus Aenigmarchaeota archaeon]|nr:UPF0147 family protein [Candidatus Aenigmarchaeota archaeon]
MDDKLLELHDELNYMIESIKMPRKIRESLTECAQLLKEEDKKDNEKLNNTMLVLEDINAIKTISPILRTEIWNLIGKLEVFEKSESYEKS